MSSGQFYGYAVGYLKKMENTQEIKDFISHEYKHNMDEKMFYMVKNILKPYNIVGLVADYQQTVNA